MGSGRRITVALVALVLLAVVGWAVSRHDRTEQQPQPPAVTSQVSPSAPTPAAASR